MAALLAAALLAGPASGQVRLQDTGNALDANPQIGGRGANPQVRTNRIDSQLYVTGQVSGLGAFSGRRGYYAPDQLNLSLPTAGLDTFRRQSVGVQQVLGGSTYYTTPYFTRDQTVVSAGVIDDRLNQPGTSTPLSHRLDTRTWRRLYESALEEYKPALQTGTIDLSASAGMPLAGNELPSLAGTRMAEELARARTAKVFGVLSQEDREDLARQLAAMEEDEQTPAPGQEDTRLKDRLGDRIQGELQDREKESVPGSELAEGATRGGNVTPQAAAMPKADEDVYFDLLRFMGEKGQKQENELGALPQMPDGSLPVPKAEPNAPANEEEESSGVTMTGTEGIVLHSLAGKSRDDFNRYMSSAEGNLAAKAYYRAAADYNYASLVDPRNPLAPLGRAVALFGAGEPMSAAFHLRRALEMFPPLMEARVELVQKIDRNDLQRETARLDNRLEKEGFNNEAQLLLLATFIDENLGRTAAAKKYAERLLKRSENDPLGRAYAQYVLTGRRPADVSASRPGTP